MILWLITFIYKCILLLFVNSYQETCFCFRFCLLWDRLSHKSGWHWTCYVAGTNRELLIHLPSAAITSVCHQIGYFGTLVSDKDNPKFTSYKGSHSSLFGSKQPRRRENLSRAPDIQGSTKEASEWEWTPYNKNKTLPWDLGKSEPHFLNSFIFIIWPLPWDYTTKCPRLRLSQRDGSKVISFHNEAEDVF